LLLFSKKTTFKLCYNIHLINKLLVPPESENLSLAPFEGILSLLVGVVVVLEVIVGRLDPLVLEFVDGVNVQRNVILQTSGLGLAGQLSCGFGLKIVGRLKFINSKYKMGNLGESIAKIGNNRYLSKCDEILQLPSSS
jgi:hypothetical protein